MTESNSSSAISRRSKIEQRKSLTLDLLSERDDLITAVDEKRREIRALNKSRRNLESRTAQIRREIRSGKVLEPRQTSLSLPPADAARPNRFEELYPLPTTEEQLLEKQRQQLQRAETLIQALLERLEQQG